jgi:hypothetical protein
MALERGHVIAMRRSSAAIVWSIAATHALVVPLGGYNGPPPHRAEIRFDDPAEIFSCGVTYKWPVARCHQLFQMTRASAEQSPIMGKASDDLLLRISAAIRREAQSQATERRLHFNDAESPVLFAST